MKDELIANKVCIN